MVCRTQSKFSPFERRKFQLLLSCYSWLSYELMASDFAINNRSARVHPISIKRLFSFFIRFDCDFKLKTNLENIYTFYWKIQQLQSKLGGGGRSPRLLDPPLGPMSQKINSFCINYTCKRIAFSQSSIEKDFSFVKVMLKKKET